MRLFAQWWRAAIAAVEAKPILLVWFAVFAVGVIFNFRMGWALWGIETGFLFASIAILGAYAASQVETSGGARRAWMWLAVAGAIMLGQWCGWQQMGLRMSRGLGVLAGEAGQHNTAADGLANARAEREKLGAQRPVAAIAAERELECKRTSKRYKDGKGPDCTALMSEEAAAQRAAELDAQLPGLAKSLAEAPETTDPNALFGTPIKIGNVLFSFVAQRPVALSNDDVIFGFSIFIILLMEGFSICGPWLFRLEAAPAAPEQPRKRLTYARPQQDQDEYQGDGLARLARPPASEADQGGQPAVPHASPEAARGADAGGHLERQQRSADAGGHLERQQRSADAGGHLERQQSVQQHGAPIHVNLYTGGQGGGQGGGHSAGQGAPAVAVANENGAGLVDRVADRNVAALRAAGAAAMPADANAPPVVRAPVQQVTDGILSFRAACLTDMPGALTPLSDVFARYQAFRGERAVTDATFKAFFPEVTGLAIADVGGEAYVSGATWRKLKVAAS